MYGSVMRIGEVSRRLGVSREHLRALERAGRIPKARRLDGDRVYGAVDVRLLQEIGIGSRPNRLKTLDGRKRSRVEAQAFP
jgi:hypothetical protein